MKKIVCALLALMLMTSAALAAEWPEGCSAAKPYANTPEVDLTQSMGYIILYPNTRVNMDAQHFCDLIKMFLPREDIVLGEGNIRVYSNGNVVETINCADDSHVVLRAMTEDELTWLMWGSGVCIEAYLTDSLTMGQSYYVQMEENCFTAADGTLKNRSVTTNDAWVLNVVGDYGISALRYTPAEGNEHKVKPGEGDQITFDLVIGGDAKYAVVFSDNDSVSFETPEFTESGTITGTVTKDEVNWGIVFLNEEGVTLDAVRMNR